jgi:hypothetical protein
MLPGITGESISRIDIDTPANIEAYCYREEPDKAKLHVS